VLDSAIPTVAISPLQLSFTPWPDKKLFTQNMTNVTFIFKPLQMQNIKKKCGWTILYPHRLKKVGGPGGRVPHLNAWVQEVSGGEAPLQIFSPPWKNVLDIV